MLCVLALPFGFVEEDVAVIAGVYGMYFVLPAVVAWCLEAVRTRMPRFVQRTLGVLILLVAIPAIAFWVLWTGLWFALALPSTVVVLIVAFRLLRAGTAS